MYEIASKEPDLNIFTTNRENTKVIWAYKLEEKMQQ